MEWRPCWTYLEVHCLHNLRGPSGWLFSFLLFWGLIKVQTSSEKSISVLDIGFPDCKELTQEVVDKWSSALGCLWHYWQPLWFSMVLRECYFCIQPLSPCLFCKLHSLPHALTEHCSQGLSRKWPESRHHKYDSFRGVNLTTFSLTWPRWKATSRCLHFPLAQNPYLPGIWQQKEKSLAQVTIRGMFDSQPTLGSVQDLIDASALWLAHQGLPTFHLCELSLRPYRPHLMPWSPPGHCVLLLSSQVPSAPLRATREKIISLQRTASLLAPTSALLLFVNAYKTSFLHQLKTRVKFTFEGVPHPCLSHSAYSYYSQMKRPRSPSSTLIPSRLPQRGSKHHCPFLVGKPLSSRCIFGTFCLCWWTEKLLRNKTLIFCCDAGEFLYSVNRSDPDCTVPKGPSVQ